MVYVVLFEFFSRFPECREDREKSLRQKLLSFASGMYHEVENLLLLEKDAAPSTTMRNTNVLSSVFADTSSKKMYPNSSARSPLTDTKFKLKKFNHQIPHVQLLQQKIRTLLDEQKQKVLAECQARNSQHEFQAARAEEDQRLLQGRPWQQKLEFREAHDQSLKEMEELKKFQSSTIDTIARRRSVEGQDAILELSGRVQELQNEVNCINDSKDFQDAESVRSGKSHVTSRPVSFTPHPILEGMLRPSFVTPSRREGLPSIWDTWYLGNVFANPTASASAPCPQKSNPWISNVSEHTSPHVMSESQTPVQD